MADNNRSRTLANESLWVINCYMALLRNWSSSVDRNYCSFLDIYRWISTSWYESPLQLFVSQWSLCVTLLFPAVDPQVAISGATITISETWDRSDGLIRSNRCIEGLSPLLLLSCSTSSLTRPIAHLRPHKNVFRIIYGNLRLCALPIDSSPF